MQKEASEYVHSYTLGSRLAASLECEINGHTSTNAYQERTK